MADEASVSTTKKAKPKIPVVMQDGRTVEFPEDAKALKDTLWQSKEGKLTDSKEEALDPLKPVGARWDFSNGQTRTILLNDLIPLYDMFAVHGLLQKGGDEYASEKEVDDAQLAFDDLMDRLKKGTWSERREGGFGGVSVLAKAIAEAFSKPMEEVRAFLRDLSPAEKVGLRQSPELKPIVERLESEKAKSSKVDTVALLARAKSFQIGTQPQA